MIGAVQTFGDLVHFHSHVHTIVPEGVFTQSGHFVHIPDIWLHRAIEIWQEKVLSLLLDVGRIDQGIVANMRDWKHSGFSVDISVRIEADDHSGMQRLVEYISRCPTFRQECRVIMRYTIHWISWPKSRSTFPIKVSIR
jgi:hypothetical protein